MTDDRCPVAYLRVRDERTGEEHLFVVPRGATLRDALRDADCSPHAPLVRRANCGGRGLCGTCGVRLDDAPVPDHWHDALADRWGYPRLSCQVDVNGDLTVTIPEKRVWGRRE
jgi:ferredoxin